jgi:hypothetical protein
MGGVPVVRALLESTKDAIIVDGVSKILEVHVCDREVVLDAPRLSGDHPKAISTGNVDHKHGRAHRR